MWQPITVEQAAEKVQLQELALEAVGKKKGNAAKGYAGGSLQHGGGVVITSG